LTFGKYGHAQTMEDYGYTQEELNDREELGLPPDYPDDPDDDMDEPEA
jgi:hypothetical protein